MVTSFSKTFQFMCFYVVLFTQHSSCSKNCEEFVNNWRVWRYVNYLFNSISGFISSYISSFFCPDPATGLTRTRGLYGIDIFRLKVLALDLPISEVQPVRSLTSCHCRLCCSSSRHRRDQHSLVLSLVSRRVLIYLTIWRLIVYMIKPFCLLSRTVLVLTATLPWTAFQPSWSFFSLGFWVEYLIARSYYNPYYTASSFCIRCWFSFFLNLKQHKTPSIFLYFFHIL